MTAFGDGLPARACEVARQPLSNHASHGLWRSGAGWPEAAVSLTRSLLSCGYPIQSEDGINQPIERHMCSVGRQEAATSLAGPGPKQRYRRDQCLK